MHQAANDNRMTDAGSVEPPAPRRACPICGKPAVVEVRPFCSKRCADIDLHKWLGGQYAVPAAESDDPDTVPDGSDD